MPFDSPKRGDIYHVDFPKPRGPHYAVVITDDSINDSSNAVVVALITSKSMDNIWPYQMRVPKHLLEKASKIVCSNVYYMEKSQLKRESYRSSLDEQDLQGLDAALLKTFGLWR